MSSDTRINDLKLWPNFRFDEYEESILIQFPEKKSTRLPEPVSFKNDYFSYELSAKKSGKDIEVTRKFKLLQDQIPVADFAQIKEIFRQIIKADEMKLTML
jgi:hypothetical protein